MPRTARVAPGGMVFHVINRSVGRMPIFESDADYAAFERIIEETLLVSPMRICAYQLMPNHWHFVMWPRRDGELAEFMQRMTITHVRRWKENRGQVGYGPMYQRRYKSFPVESDDYFFQVVRYVERNALRANLVARAEDWRWSSLWRWNSGTADPKALLSDWPLSRPRLSEPASSRAALRRAAIPSSSVRSHDSRPAERPVPCDRPPWHPRQQGCIAAYSRRLRAER